MNQALILSKLESVGAMVRNTHVVYTSGRHGDTYVNKDAIYPHTALISELASIMAEQVLALPIEIVVAPALGGIVLSQWLAHHLSCKSGREILAIYAEKDSAGGFEFRRGYDRLIKDKAVLIAEDVVTTGGSVLKVVDAVIKCRAKPLAVSLLCNRGSIPETLNGLAYHWLLKLDLNSWEPATCPLCLKKIPVSPNLGKGPQV